MLEVISITAEEKAKAPLNEEIMDHLNRSEQKINKERIQKQADKYNSKDTDSENRKEIIWRTTYSLIDKFKILTVAGTKQSSDTIYRYSDGIYLPDGEAYLRKEIEFDFDLTSTSHLVREIIEKVKRKTLIDREVLYSTPYNLICLKNGIYDLNTKELKPHSHKNIFLSKIPVNYNPSAQCPNIAEFLVQVLEPQDIIYHMEFLGYCLYRKNVFKKALICLGEADTGKTTLLNLYTKFLGENNVSNETLQKINKDRFSAAALQNKHANIYDDLPSTELNDVGTFKQVTGGGYITVEQKFGDRYPAKLHVKLIYAANRIPPVKDVEDLAYYGRWLLSRFNNKFSDEKRDIFLIDKLTTDEELSGLLNLAFAGLENLLKKGFFSYPLSYEDNRKVMLLSSDPLVAFVDECLEQDVESSIPKNIFYDAYVEYCKVNRYVILSKTALTQNLPKYAPGFATAQRKVDGVRVEVYVGYRIRNKSVDKEDNDGVEQTKLDFSDKNSKSGLSGLLEKSSYNVLPQSLLSGLFFQPLLENNAWYNNSVYKYTFYNPIYTGKYKRNTEVPTHSIKTKKKVLKPLTADSVLKHIQQKGPCFGQDIANQNGWPQEGVDKILHYLASQGDIFQPRPDFWQALDQIMGDTN